MRENSFRSWLPVEKAQDDQISTLIGPSRIVALGESFHHSHELLEARFRLTRALVRAGGVRQILLEAVRPGPGPISSFVNGDGSDGVAALAEAGARMWQNRETLALLTWLRTFNLDRPEDPVTIEGIDILAPGQSMRALAKWATPGEAERIIEVSRLFDQDGRSDQIGYNGLSGAERDWLKACFLQLEADPEGPDAATLRQHQRIVLQSLAMMDAGSAGWVHGFAHRDRALAENVAGAASDREGRTLILSHNMHVNAAAWRQPESRHPITPMGSFLRERFHSDYVVLGTTFGTAAFNPPIYGIESLSACETGTIDEGLDLLSAEPMLVDLRTAGPIGESAMMGTDVEGGTTLSYPNLADAFDLLLHLPRIGNAQPLFDTDLDLDIAAVDRSRSLVSGSAGAPI